ncbi:hypothetical protein [Polaromonas sp.]|uniref:hypothetical protein n=1 Tax=Polaromonas sp. TaxID=1869339 RepID=UPI003752D4F9
MHTSVNIFKQNTASPHMQPSYAAIKSIAYTDLKRSHQSSLRQARAVVLRVAGAVAGGYAFTTASVGLMSASLALGGMPRSDAVVLAAMLGFVIYLLVLLWAFSVRSLVRLWATLTGAGLLAAGLTFVVH